MHNINAILEQMREYISMGPIRIKEASEQGKKIVGVYCAYSPDELIYAAGAIPVGLCAKGAKPIAAAEERLPRNLCPLIKSSYGYALTDSCPYFHFCDLIVGETTCDGKKKMYELLDRLCPTHVMQLPQTVNEDGYQLWEREMRRLGERMEHDLGTEITGEALKREIAKKNRERRIMTDFYELSSLDPVPLSGREVHMVSEYAKVTFGDEEALNLVSHLTKCVRENYEAGERRFDSDLRRVIVTGCPTGTSVLKVFDAIEENGGVIVAFENCGGIKPKYEHVSETLPPYRALAEKYLNLPCSCMSPNHARLELLGDLADEYGAEGVVDLILQACHTYNVESYLVHEYMKEELDIPVITVETDYYQGDVEQLSTRMGAFVEMLD